MLVDDKVSTCMAMANGIIQQMNKPALKFDFKLTELIFKENSTSLAESITWVFSTADHDERFKRMALTLRVHGTKEYQAIKARDEQLSYSGCVVNRLAEYYA